MPRMFNSAPPGRRMLWRGPGRVCSTATYQKMICTSCGVLRTSSMKPSAILRTSQLADSRMMPTKQPEQRRRDDAHRGDQQRVEHANQQRPGIGIADRPGESAGTECRNWCYRRESRSRTSRAAARCSPPPGTRGTRRPPPRRASSSHCAARARGDGRLTTSGDQCQVGVAISPPLEYRLFMPRGRPRPPLVPNVASYTSP